MKLELLLICIFVVVGYISAESDANNHTAYIYGSQCAALLDGIHVHDQATTNPALSLLIDEEDSTFDCDKNTTQKLTIKFAPNQVIDGAGIIDSISLNFVLSNNLLYWVLSSASLVLNNSNVSLPLYYMGAPYGMETPTQFSFACTNTVFLLGQSGKNNRINVYIEKFQIQPINVLVKEDETGYTNYSFGRINYCQGFFSSGIWMAISASVIMTFILAFGISLLFNIKALDRFDDPKGKPLNVGAEK